MKNLAMSYIQFLQNMGEADIHHVAQIVEDAVTHDVKKIINNDVVCVSVLELSQQLVDVRNMGGKLAITLLNHCNDSDNQQCAVRYLLESELVGNFSTLAIIDYNAQGKIVQIDEIYTQL